MIDPVHRAVQDAAANILAGLSHHNPTVRAAARCLIAENHIRTQSPLTIQGDRTPNDRIDFIRHHAEIQLHQGNQRPPNPRTPRSFQPDRRYLLDNLPQTALTVLAASKLPHPIHSAPPHRQTHHLQQTVDHWPPLPIQPSPAQARAQALIIH